MSDLPAKEMGSGLYRLAGEGPARAGSKSTVKVVEVDPRRATQISATTVYQARAWPHLVGLALLIAACLLGAASPDAWHKLVRFFDRSWSTESWRWIAVALLATTGVSFLQTRPIFFVIAAAQCGLALFCLDVLLDGRAARWTEMVVGVNRAPLVLLIISAAFGYLVHADVKAHVPSLRGILGLLVVATAALGMTLNWFNWSERTQYLKEWGPEAAWATVLLLTAVGVSMSRGRPIQLLIAIILIGLAYSCVKAGYAREVRFPELSTATHEVSISHESYTNVDTWRWVVCAELVCLSIVLVHLSLGIGAMTVLFAGAWMVIGLSLYNTVSTLSAARVMGVGMAQVTGGPLGNMGLPMTQAANGPPLKPLTPAQKQQMEDVSRQFEKETTVREATTFGWMLCMAVLGGVICIAGLRMLSDDRGYHAAASALIFLSFIAGAVLFAWIWPKDSTLADLKFSRYHRYIFWLAFGGSMSVFGAWAMLGRRPASAWVNLAIAAIFVGTAATLSGAAIIIRYGGFSPLPVWVYCLIAAAQSSLAWALLFHLKPPVHSAPAIIPKR